ncbi:hypothetical protein FCN80_13370 [Martelella alba]|uniref:C-type lysozyme inhibitor domain-containing protein n=2 Tax=Martelella alba TaxID=2590451 RepID=A0ABY2SJP9_9HYPH|nr:hypothetical protein FCN80_13370 [Martelella alba]
MAAVLGGCSSWRGHGGDNVRVLHYRCGTMPLTVRQEIHPARVRLILDGQALTLTQTVSASGVRYSDGRYVFWSKGPQAFIERDNRVIIDDCRLASGYGK